ncbi:hypothetical protein H5410_063264 [Solanum commersonii]|uniref:Uncharacterized protein n=1 Tax=Solanum commersonii TaxID=4109 RepID=A0A9J5WD26_SOLCO|nr:hypothetical protein H5410_063264 [Solanum commersonii]
MLYMFREIKAYVKVQVGIRNGHGRAEHIEYSYHFTLWGGPVVWSWDLEVSSSKPLSSESKGFAFWVDLSHKDCLVWVTSPMWFASDCIGAELLPCALPKGSWFLGSRINQLELLSSKVT